MKRLQCNINSHISVLCMDKPQLIRPAYLAICIFLIKVEDGVPSATSQNCG